MPLIKINGVYKTQSPTQISTYATHSGISYEQFMNRHGHTEQGYQGISFNILPQAPTFFNTPQTNAGDEVFVQLNAQQNTVNIQTNTNTPLQQLVKYKPMVLRKNDSTLYEKNHSLKNKPFEWATLQGMVGIEIEVENITQPALLLAYWEAKGDGSLRNNGIELVSVPLQIKQVQLALEHVFETLYQNNKPDFSNRTSIHIHVNCRDLTQDQLYNFILLYAIFEKHFYNVVGNKRLNSIFCVPVFRTNQLKYLNTVVYGLSPDWHKYCGLNLLPLYQNSVTQGYGTIEFRHLHGTSDQQEILEWINDILCLRKFACEVNKEELIQLIKEMNTTSSYLSLYSQVFAKGRKILSNKKDFEECVSNTKRELFGDDYMNTLKRSDNSPYWTTVNELGIRG
jgi:hypothetical protein